MEIYYALWAGMAEWNVYQRAMVVLIVVMAKLWLVLFVLKIILSKLCIVVGKYGVGFCFVLRQNMMRNEAGFEQQMARIEEINRLSERFERCEAKFYDRATRLLKGNGRLLVLGIVIYAICIIMIALPDVLKNVVNEDYIDKFMFAKEIYYSVEADTLEKAEAYKPLFSRSQEMNDTEVVLETEEKVWYILSEKGKDGANLRSGPGTKYDVIEVLSGEVRMNFIEETGNWMKVNVENGNEGWINKTLLDVQIEN